MSKLKSTKVRADLFWFSPEDGNLKDILVNLSQAAVTNHDEIIDVDHYGRPHRLEDLVWDAGKKRINGVLYKKRTSRFPAELAVSGGRALKLSSGNTLGFPTCFVYCPRNNLLAVQYEHIGARASCLSAFMPQLECDYAYSIFPVLSLEAAERLNSTNIIRRAEYKIERTQDFNNTNFDGIDLGVRDSVNLLNETGAYSVSVQVSIGKKSRDEGLGGKVKKSLQKMLDLGECVSTLKFKGRSDVDEDIETVDLINDKISTYFQVKEASGRRIDTADCIVKLDRFMDQILPELRNHPDKP